MCLADENVQQKRQKEKEQKYIYILLCGKKKKEISDRQQAVYIIVIYCIHSLRLYIFH